MRLYTSINFGWTSFKHISLSCFSLLKCMRFGIFVCNYENKCTSFRLKDETNTSNVGATQINLKSASANHIV